MNTSDFLRDFIDAAERFLNTKNETIDKQQAAFWRFYGAWLMSLREPEDPDHSTGLRLEIVSEERQTFTEENGKALIARLESDLGHLAM